MTAQVCACRDAERVHLGCGLRAHAMKLRDRKRRHEGLSFVRQNSELAVWLAMIRSELRQELVEGNSGRGGKPGFPEDASPHLLGGLPCGRDAAGIVSDVEVGLIKRKG